MGIANIKLSTIDLEELKKVTGETTGQKAVQKALLYFLKEARQRRITKLLETVRFSRDFSPLKLRKNER